MLAILVVDGNFNLHLRFVSPPQENRANHPYVNGQVNSGQSEPGFVGKPHTSFSYNPTVPTAPSPYSYSPLPNSPTLNNLQPQPTPTTSRPFLHLGQLPLSDHPPVEQTHDKGSFQSFSSPPVGFADFQITSHQTPSYQGSTGSGYQGPALVRDVPENVVRHLPVPHAQYLPTFVKQFSDIKETARQHFPQVLYNHHISALNGNQCSSQV